MLRGKVAIVTGSTSGIGLGIAKVLAKHGADIVLNGFGDAAEIDSIRTGIARDHDVRALYDGADMSKGEAVRGLVAATAEKLGRVDSLVNNPVPAGLDVIVRVHILFSCSMTPYCEIRIRRRAPAAPTVNARDIAAILLVC